MLTVEVGGEPLSLLPEKAAFLPRHRTLLVADAHIGKAVTFRRLGVPVPRGTTTDTLSRLSALVEHLEAQHLVFLGDFLHSDSAMAAATQAALLAWRERHARLQVTLVRGNHDARAGDPPAGLGFEVVDEPFGLGGLALCHHPQRVAGAYALGGHLHPCTGVGRGLDRLRLPCFWLRPDSGVLPAFGAFTGMHPVRAEARDRLFVVAEGQVRAVG
ncbi:MAG: ligase-associated DNA damage response endonuclease PdeM [Pseudomonadota bacterium]